MEQRISSRTLPLELIQRAITDITSEMGISKHMDLRVPSNSIGFHDVNKVECECCGLFEACTRAYIHHIKSQMNGKWVCGLCSEAIIEESHKLGTARDVSCEEALHAHIDHVNLPDFWFPVSVISVVQAVDSSSFRQAMDRSIHFKTRLTEQK
ncbi:Protein of unknown function DUF1677, plant [Dillenia turbinata]|uniref:Uncharacterized protein n=1 Tax=Dillenia turbinata TaxID=194707 RepID=A0AAN8W9X5_9MAGN